MKLFLDSVRLAEIESVIARGVVSGLTTNPTFLHEEAPTGPMEHLRRIVDRLRPLGLPVSVQVMTTDTGEMVSQAETIARELDYRGLVVKVPCGWDELAVISELRRRGIAVNCTACMTTMQAMMAAAAGASYVTLFYGKMGDAGIDAAAAIEDAANGFHRRGAACDLMVASLRRAYDVHECLRRGADVAAVPFRFLPMLSEHPKTEEVVSLFARSFMPV
jgi:transaldolase